MTTQAFSPDAVNLWLGSPADAPTGAVTVRMKTNKYYTDGTLVKTNTNYVVTRAWGKLAVESGWASYATSPGEELSRPSLNSLAVSQDIQFGNKRKPTFSGRVFCFGDSTGLGTGLASPSTSRFGALFAAAKGVAEINNCIDGSCIGRWVNDQIASRPFLAGDRIVMHVGFNDARYGGIVGTNMTMFSLNLLGTLCYLGVPDANKLFTQTNSTTLNTTGLTFSGAWSANTVWAGAQAQSKCGALSTTIGDYIEAKVSGDVVHIMLANYVSFASACTISVDGVTLGAGNFSAQPLIDIADAVGGTVWQPYCIRIPGLSNGPHTVRVTNQTVNNLVVAYIAGYDSTTNQLPVLYVGGPIRMTVAGYAVAPANANDVVMRLYMTEARRVVDFLAAEGLLVRYVEIDAQWLPSTASLNADNVHPLEMTHKLWAQRFIYEDSRPSLI